LQGESSAPNNRPRQYYPDFIVVVRDPAGLEVMWLAKTKGEMRSNTVLKNQAAEIWCEKMNTTKYGPWQYLFAQQAKLLPALAKGTTTFTALAKALS
jgi:hypothetical protein